MPARKSTPPRRPVEDDLPGGRQQAIAFARGLYPILLEGDVEDFRRYLARWEDVIGDTAEIAEMPAEQQRRTMAAILRRPQQFNLPSWADALKAVEAGQAEPAEEPPPAALSAPPATMPPAPQVASPAPPSPPERAAPPAESERDAAATAFQVDMLTGELVPVVRELPGGYNAPADGSATGARPARTKRPRRRVRSSNLNLTQLTLWTEDLASG